MMDLLIGLQRFEHSMQIACHRRQLTPSEQAAAWRNLTLVREVLPVEVLAHYDRMKTSHAELMESPELFVMAVLVSTYCNLSRRKRQELLAHFATKPRAASVPTGHRRASRNFLVRPFSEPDRCKAGKRHTQLYPSRSDA